MTHEELTAALLRQPGQPASDCQGTMRRIAGDGSTLADDAPGQLDDALIYEGRTGQKSDVRLYRCDLCGDTIVEATAPDGKRHCRNAYGTKDTQPIRRAVSV